MIANRAASSTVKAQIRGPVIDVIRAAIEDGTDPLRAGWFTDETKAAPGG